MYRPKLAVDERERKFMFSWPFLMFIAQMAALYLMILGFLIFIVVWYVGQ